MALGKAFTIKPLLNLVSHTSWLDPVFLAFRSFFDILIPDMYILQ